MQYKVFKMPIYLDSNRCSSFFACFADYFFNPAKNIDLKIKNLGLLRMRSVEKKFSTDFKAKVALAALKGDKTLAELEKEFVVPAGEIQEWKQQLINNICRVFEEDRDGLSTHSEGKLAISNHAKIGELIAENDFLTKVLGR